VALFAVVYNVPRYFESTFVWNATENVGYFARTSLGSSTLYTRLYVRIRHPPHIAEHRSNKPTTVQFSTFFTWMEVMSLPHYTVNYPLH